MVIVLFPDWMLLSRMVIDDLKTYWFTRVFHRLNLEMVHSGPFPTSRLHRRQPQQPAVDNTTLTNSNTPFGQPTSSSPLLDQPTTTPTPTPTPTPTSDPNNNTSQQQSSSSSSVNPNPTSTSTQEPSPTPLPTSSTAPPISSTPITTSTTSTTTTSTFTPSPTTSEPAPQPTSSSSSFPPGIIPVTSSVQSSPPSSTPTTSPQDPQSSSTTSQVFRTSTDSNGGIHTITTYVDVPVTVRNTSTQTISNQPTGQLNNGENPRGGFFENQGAVIGTFLTLGLVVLAGLVAIIWRVARLRKNKLNAKELEGLDLDKFVGNDPDDDGRRAMLPLPTIDLDEPNQVHNNQTHPDFLTRETNNYHHPDPAPAFMGIPELYPTRPSAGFKPARASDLETMNGEEWSRYVNTHFTPSGAVGLTDGARPDLMRVEEEEGPPPLPSACGTPSQPHILSTLSQVQPNQIATVEEEQFAIVNSPPPDWNQHHPADHLLESSALPNHSFDPDRADESSSLRDEEDYSRRILKVSNPDIEEKEDHHAI